MERTRRLSLYSALVFLPLLAAQGCQDAGPPPPVIRPTPAAASAEAIVVTAPVPPPSDYVGSQVCAQCHAEISKTYGQTTMANSAALASEAHQIENYEADWVTTSRGFRTQATQTGSGIVHTEQLLSTEGQVLCQQSLPVAYELGSGKRGRSYLIERDDQMVMSPLTWYSTALKWDISPGYTKNNHHFERKIVSACVQCHVGRIAPATSPRENRFAHPALQEAGIGCERCHGPGGRHVALHRDETLTKIALTSAHDPIVNPASLTPELRESICYECHLLGAERVLRNGKKDEDFRPGDPLHSTWVIFEKGQGGVGADQTTEAVNQVQQMESSQCFQRSNGQFGCLSCHDPHSQPSPEAKIDFYRHKCLSCHDTPNQECASPREDRVKTSPEDSCISCHMPSLVALDVEHTSQTDHRVLRSPLTQAQAEPQEPLRLARGMDSLPKWEVQRARGLLMTQFAIEYTDPALATLASETLLPLTERGLRDPIVERSLGDAFLLQNRLELAEPRWRTALDLNPYDELALRSLSIAVHDSGRDAEAEELYSRYLKTNRWDRVILGRHVHVLGRLQRTDEAFREAEEVISKYPYDPLVREWMANACEAAGRLDEANVHRAIAERLAPRP